MATIFRKTLKGIEEIQTRAHRLTPRARSALILVDGQRSDDDLAKLISVQAAETLRSLIDGGFIEASASIAAAPAAPAPPPPQPAVNFELVRREAVRRLLDQVGPAIGETLAVRMERAGSMDVLRPLLITARGVIANLRGERAAADYIAALSAL